MRPTAVSGSRAKNSRKSGTFTAAELPALTARLMPMPESWAQFMNDETKLPDWLAMPMRPLGGYGATICAQRSTGVEMRPWPLGPTSKIPSSSARATSSSSAWRPSAPASRYPAEATKAAVMPLAAHAFRSAGLAAAGVHTKTRSISPSGRSSISATVGTPRTSAPSRFVAKTLPW